jgi:hypothetical protein
MAFARLDPMIGMRSMGRILTMSVSLSDRYEHQVPALRVTAVKPSAEPVRVRWQAASARVGDRGLLEQVREMQTQRRRAGSSKRRTSEEVG